MEKQVAIDELNRLKEVSRQMGGKERIERQHQRGHLTVRERIDRLFDAGSFVETGIMMQNLMPDREGKITHISRVSGFGKIDGRTAIVQADDATVSAGPGGRAGGGQSRGFNPRIYPENCYPIINLHDSGGDEAAPSMAAFGRPGVAYPTRELVNLRKVPHVAAIMSDCLSASALQAATADFVVMVKGTSMALCEPTMLGLALEEESTPEELGSWQLHDTVTGQVDAIANDDEHCLQIIREFLSYMPSNCDEEPPYVPTADPPDRKVERLMKLIPDKSNRVYDMYQVIKEIVDDGKYFSLKPYYAKALITCLARMNGKVVGIIANQTLHNAGAAGPDECDKATSFICLCDSFNIPLIHLCDIPGFLVGRPAEKRKIPTKIMTWMEALALATVPKITVIVRKAYGMGISNMCGPNCGPDFISALTTADISFMSPEAAANVVYARKIEEAEDPEAEKGKLIKEMEYGNAPWEAAATGWLDDVLNPPDTRKYIIDCLEIMHSRKNGFISNKQLQSWPTGF